MTNETGDERQIENATYQLRKLLTVEGSELAQDQQWLWEFDRWKELVFALLVRMTSVPEADLRLLVEQMTDLDHLDYEILAAAEGTTLEGERISALLMEAGIDSETAAKVLTTLVEAAQGIKRSYGGKVQKYLRRYGELMLREVHDSFDFTALKPTEVEDAFTYWLQNVTHLPLSLVDDSIRSFCERHRFTPSDLIKGADQIDMNLTVVDDLVQLHVLTNETAWSETDQEPQL